MVMVVRTTMPSPSTAWISLKHNTFSLQCEQRLFSLAALGLRGIVPTRAKEGFYCLEPLMGLLCIKSHFT